MSFWVIVSWVFVVLLTVVNVVIFLKLKQASEQMLKMAFPNAKNMSEAMAGLQNMMGGMGGMGGMAGMQNMMAGMQGGPNRAGGRGGIRNSFGGGGAKNQQDAQLKAAMDMLNKMKKR
jgi:hypothetical protein